MSDSQEKWLLRTLKRGQKITPLRALEEFGIFRLAARVNSLRDRGHKIITVMVEDGDKKYARYHLERAA